MHPPGLRRLFATSAVLLVAANGPFAADVLAQPQRTGTLQVTVVDPSGAVIANATVIVAGIEEATKSAVLPPVATSPAGIASVANLVPGRYSVQAAFPGFETRALPDVRVRAGDNRQVLLLPIEGVRDAVTVERDRQEAAADRGTTFGTTLTREQLDGLSDDPDELRRQLQDMAGPGAVIKVDSFEGGALPAKAQIRSIRISRDQFAAENHAAGGTSIEIITQPGLSPIRYNVGMRLRGDGLSGRSPFTPTRGPEQLTNYFVGLGGTLIPEKSSFNLNVNGLDSYQTPIINAVSGTGTRSEALRLRTPRNNLFVNANVDYALTLDQTLRFGYQGSRNTVDNLGIGEYDYEERAYATEDRGHTVRAQHMGPLGRRAFTRTRLQLQWSDSESRSAVEAPTIRVLDAFTAGGAQVAGGRHSRALTVATDLDYVRSIHTFRTGLQVDASRVRADDTSNYIGTYTFESEAAFAAGTPRSFTRRIGDPNVRYSSLQGAWYLQDDMRVRRNLTISSGLRYEVQSHVHDYDNLMPRVGFTYAPFPSGATTLRGSWGIFHDWMQNQVYEQTLRVDGFRQREVDIPNPAFPELSEVGPAPPVNRYYLGEVRLPRTSRVSAGIDQRVLRGLQSTVTYSYQRGVAVFRGLNQNAPLFGSRPDERFGNVIEVVSDGESRQHQVQTNLTMNPGALLPAFNARRIDPKRVTMFLNYAFTDLKNNTDGPFATPATGTLEQEWGSPAQDIPHRFNLTINNQIVRNLLMSFNLNVFSGAPYTLRTGFDENGDLIYNDRPAGVGRGTERMPVHWTINPAMAYTFTFGRQTRLPPGVTVIAGGGAATVQSFDQNSQRFRVQLIVQAQNVTNRANYVGYSGVQTSRYFGRPTAVLATRKVDMGVQFSF